MHFINAQKLSVDVFSQMGAVPSWALLPTPYKKRDVQDLFFHLVLTEEGHPPVMLALEYKNPELVCFSVCMFAFVFNIPKSFLVLKLKTSKQTKNSNRIWASCYICIQHLQSDLNKTRGLFRMSLDSKQTSEESEDTLKAHTNHTLNRHCTGLGDFAFIPSFAQKP